MHTANPANPTWRGPAWLQREQHIAALEAKIAQQRAMLCAIAIRPTPPAAALRPAPPIPPPPTRPRWMAAGHTTEGHTALTVIDENGYPVGQRPSAAERHAIWRDQTTERAIAFAKDYTYTVVPRQPWETS